MNRPADTMFHVRMRFRPGGPVNEGEWRNPDTAQDRYTQWVGLYGSDLNVVIQILEESNGREHVRKTWTAGGEVQGRAT